MSVKKGIATLLLAMVLLGGSLAAAKAAPLAAGRYGTAVDVSHYGASPAATPAQNVAAINKALAENHYVRIITPGVYLLDDHLTLFSHSKLECGPGVTIRQTATVCILRNAHMLAVSPDSDITVQGGTWDGNYTGRSPGDQVAPTDLSQPLQGVDGEIDAIGVNGFTVRDVLIQHCRAFGIQVSSSNDVTVSNVRLDIAKDGIHINGPGARFHLAHISGYTGDDFIALNAWDWVDSSPTAGDITDVDIADITQLAQSPTIPANTNQFGLIKFLAGTRHGQTANIARVHVDGVRGVNSYRAFTFLVDRDPREHVPSGPGVVADVSVAHVAVKTVHSPLFWLGQNIHDLRVTDLQIDPESTGPIIFVNGGTTTEQLTMSGVTMRRALAMPFDVRGTIGTLTLHTARLWGAPSDFFAPTVGHIDHVALDDVTVEAGGVP